MTMVTEETIETNTQGMGSPNKVKNAMNAVKNTTDLSILKPVPARVRSRMRELKEMSSADNQKIQHGRSVKWYTTQPKMFLTKLEAEIANNIGVITYTVFKTDTKGDKAIEDNLAKVDTPEGNQKTIVISSKYVHDREVVETIEYRKPIKVEEYRPHDE